MNRSLKILLKYTFEINGEFARFIEQDIPEDLDQIPKLFHHLLAAHHLWNQRILSLPLHYDVWPILSVAERISINKENYKTSLQILDSSDPQKVIRYRSTSGKSYENTIHDILHHVVNHSTHHRAQISILARLKEITPPQSDLIFQLRNEIQT